MRFRIKALQLCEWGNTKLCPTRAHEPYHSVLNNKEVFVLRKTQLIFSDERISISDKVTNLGRILDRHMTFDDQIDHVCKSSSNHLRSLFKIRRYLDQNVASKVLHAFLTTRLDYCNPLYFGRSKYKVKRSVTTNPELCCSLCHWYKEI